jgi:hypothetical protein
MIELAGDFSETEVGGGLYIRRVYLSFLRRGLWLGATETETASASTSNPAILTTATFTDTASVLMPYTALVGIDASGAGTENDVYLCFSDDAAKLWWNEAEDYDVKGTNFASHVDATASGGDVMQLTPSSTVEQKLEFDLSGDSLNTSARLWSAFVVLANNSASVTYETRITFEFGLIAYASDTHTVGTDTTDPQIVAYSPIPLNDDIANYELHFKAIPSAASGAGHELEVDYILLRALDDDSQIIKFVAAPLGQGRGAINPDLNINHRLSSHLLPLVYTTRPSDDRVEDYPSYHGDAVLAASGNALSVMVFGLDNAGDWAIIAPTANINDFTATRTLAYLTPP